jgi:hypothetical protein
MGSGGTTGDLGTGEGPPPMLMQALNGTQRWREKIRQKDPSFRKKEVQENVDQRVRASQRHPRRYGIWLCPLFEGYCCKSPKLPGANFPAVKKNPTDDR